MFSMRNPVSFRNGQALVLMLVVLWTSAALAASALISSSPHSGHILSLPASSEQNGSISSQGVIEPRAPSWPVQPASDADYVDAESKGAILLCWIESPSLAGTQATSRFTRFEQLEEWGWTNLGGGMPTISTDYTEYRDPGIESLLGPSGSSQSHGNRVMLHHTQSHPQITNDGNVYNFPPTGASYDNMWNVDKGVIMGDFNWSPGYQLREGLIRGWDSRTDRLPALRQLSDIWWLVWAELCARKDKDPAGLNYFVKHNTVNDVTLAVLARVMRLHSRDPEVVQGRAPAWPGIVITPTMEGFKALIGTPNLWGIAYILVQRQGTLAKKHIKSITAWNGLPDKPFYQPNIIVELEDA